MHDTNISVFNPTYKQVITTYFEKFLLTKQEEMSAVNTWGEAVYEKLQAFFSQGKMIRGSLVLYTYEAFAGDISDEAITVATAMELFHASLLIHDDIMDNDTIRRGSPTIFAQFQTLAENNAFKHAHHFGESMGISVGDISFFLGFELLAKVGNPSISALCMKEMIAVGLAQMQDVYSGYTKELITESDIEKVYLYKTGRYTFSLPMILGALLAEGPSISGFEKLGEYIGLIFQYTDDALSIYGKQADTGKIEGSDIRENKKTLYRLYLFEKASEAEKNRLETIFGNEQLTVDDLSYVKQLIQRYTIQEIIDAKIHNLQSKAQENIIQLQISDPYKHALEQMVSNIIERKK